MKDTQSKSFYITCLSVISMWAVVCLHTNGVFWQFSTQRYWFTANILESLFYVAVPIFFMITGATLVDYQDRYSTKEFFVRRAQKTVIPFLAWSLIGYALQLYRGETSPSLKGLVNGVLGTSIVGIYWFFPVLFCVYLTLPLFAAVAKEKRKSVFTYLAVAGFVVNSLVPFILKAFSIDLRWPFTLNSVTDIYIYICIGYLISHYPVSSKWAALLYTTAVLGLFVHIGGTYALSVRAGDIDMTFKGYANVPCVLYATGVFLFFRRHARGTSPLARPIVFLSEYTFGVYLLHVFVMNAVQRYVFGALDIPVVSIVYRLGAPILIIPVCVLIIYLIRKVPVVRAIVP